MTLSQRLKKSFFQQHMLVDFDNIFLKESIGLETWHTCYQNRDRLMPKIWWQKNNSSTLGRVSKLVVAKIFLTTTHVDRFLISFLSKSFVLEIWYTYYQHRDGLISKISMAKRKNSIFGRLSKLATVKIISQLHMLVDFKYLFYGKSFGLEIWYTCY